MNRTTRVWRAGAVVLAAGLALTACGSDDSSGDGSSSGGDCTEQNLAFLGALTGDAGALGVNMANGIQLAVDEYNEDAECEVGLKKFDSQGSPDKAPALATEIVGDDTIIGLVGPGFSGESLATGKTFFEAGLPSISPSATNVTITEQGWTTWHRVIGNDNAQGAADAKYLTDTVGASKVYVIDDAQDYSKGLATVVKDTLGDTAVGYDEIQVGQTDMSATVTKVTAAKSDAVFYGGYYTEAGLLVKQLRQAGWRGTFMSGDGAEDPAFVKVAGQAGNGAVLSAPAAPAPEDFAAKVKDDTGSEAGLYTTQSYDAANIFLEALKAGNTEPKDINDFIGSYSGDGVSGPISFDDKGDIETSTIYAYMVKDGELDTENPTAIE
ncbi:branched-chain amino acid ABC transporter substrate-binding protein [Phycicoccus endophyticus]|uniref:Branched-chain amino acid ABC transporter substrate-binding protein n=1 Tax=Phycicoccus endophyticus TaxID=1690220 RepID=A0A7G9R3D5_9MICO|nr:branched-chain amino acid ABC transporter substrate-binding protein [Phycicoccus endophyticus]NHI19864.1 branched-chain amino acid ABC transporter substrate-binding protein [Phycicoccus endophyticus]QNN50110.1 branched-chain amino acid ABC transporter substrate-binding protein [Phycicoccus endophyticus]GGL27931.1 branched chain amino acid ABC transporter substrate-binding protein [Phycicoccus endophyticus]